MRRVAEIIYIVDEERDAFISGATKPDVDTQKVLWLCGVRKQQYFELNDLLFMTFEYDGNDFAGDMNKMASYLDSKGLLVKQRRKDVPVEQRSKTNWWAPVKRIASILDTNPGLESVTATMNLVAMLDGSMNESDDYKDIGYDEDDWSESLHI